MTHSNFAMKQVYHNIEKCCISFYRLGNQYIIVHLLIKYLSIAGRRKNLQFWMDKERHFRQHSCCVPDYKL